MGNDTLAARIEAAYSPEKTAREVAAEAGAQRDYVRSLCSRRGWPLRRHLVYDTARQLRPWPADMRFIDFKTVAEAAE